MFIIFILQKFDKVLFVDDNITWQSLSSGINESTGYFKNIIDNSLLGVGSFSTSSLKYVFTNALIKFVPPAGKSFKNGLLVDTNINDLEQRKYIWNLDEGDWLFRFEEKCRLDWSRILVFERLRNFLILPNM